MPNVYEVVEEGQRCTYVLEEQTSALTQSGFVDSMLKNVKVGAAPIDNAEGDAMFPIQWDFRFCVKASSTYYSTTTTPTARVVVSLFQYLQTGAKPTADDYWGTDTGTPSTSTGTLGGTACPEGEIKYVNRQLFREFYREIFHISWRDEGSWTRSLTFNADKNILSAIKFKPDAANPTTVAVTPTYGSLCLFVGTTLTASPYIVMDYTSRVIFKLEPWRDYQLDDGDTILPRLPNEMPDFGALTTIGRNTASYGEGVEEVEEDAEEMDF